jgi:hypothetical protein
MLSSGMWRRVDLVWTDVSDTYRLYLQGKKFVSEEPAWACSCNQQTENFNYDSVLLNWDSNQEPLICNESLLTTMIGACLQQFLADKIMKELLYNISCINFISRIYYNYGGSVLCTISYRMSRKFYMNILVYYVIKCLISCVEGPQLTTFCF